MVSRRPDAGLRIVASHRVSGGTYGSPRVAAGRRRACTPMASRWTSHPWQRPWQAWGLRESALVRSRLSPRSGDHEATFPPDLGRFT